MKVRVADKKELLTLLYEKLLWSSVDECLTCINDSFLI